MNRRRHWLHCTQDDHGPRWQFDRRRPRLMGQGEPPTPRLCVAPTVARCIVGALPNRRGQPIRVYRTQTPRRGIYPGTGLVHDCWLTTEHWLVTPCVMVLDRLIPAEVAELFTEHVRQTLRANGMEPMSPVQKAGAYLHALECLSLVEPTDRLDRGLARVIRQIFDISS